ncbi:MAG: DNA/RNA nuclease SfsA [Thermoprotei archaeon]|jgi:sugar fermentation stimulation protein A
MLIDKFSDLFRLKVIERLNRFTVLLVDNNGTKYLGLLRNTGKLKDLIYPDAVLVCKKWSRPKTNCLIIGAETKYGIALIDTYTQMRVFEKLANLRYISWLKDYEILKKEVTIDDSRLDYMIGSKDTIGYMELKSAVFMNNDTAMYPDTPSERGIRHINLLKSIREMGYRSIISFIAAHPTAKQFRPYWEVDPKIREGLINAKLKGVEIYAVKYYLDLDGNLIFETDNLPIILD